ncbi:hypothetical protein B0T24DRAFT_704698 [Lasiosphaeria ovina]|uniref:Heterokaryon incompatibility domain-containing protein n=1 Tax=Lasiosphaeria ovina TaxID=92902 RepID=A0AAE0N8N6_9PEZI|nr:hypothetical protein B0T24DRAFT_704698 [Lasiosphaeria ovina]
MDLLPSPTGKSMLGQTPYVGGSHRWDGGPFLHYACRKGWLENVPVHLRKCACSVPYRDRRHFQPLQQGEKETFLQTWLFFGLLAEFYGLNGDFTAVAPSDSSHSKATKPDPDRSVEIERLYTIFVKATPRPAGHDYDAQESIISGAPLHDQKEYQRIVSHLMRSLVDAKDSGASRHYLDYLYESLRFTAGLISSLNVSPTDFRSSIAVSVSALGEVCVSSLHWLAQRFEIPRFSGGIWGSHYLKADGDVEKEMLNKEWCRSDIERIRQSFYGLATRHFLSHLQKPKTFSHSSCSVQMCSAAQINASTYALTHVKDCAGCDTIGIDQEDVKSILKSSASTDAFPVLRFELSENGDGKVVRIHVEMYNADKPYVALSHVWADGLGNPRDNSLQSCQIDGLARLVRDISATAVDEASGKTQGGKDQPQYWFWIDTLCCPISVEEKKIALQRIAAVYQNAAHVLVLDQSIYPFPSNGKGATKTAENCLRMVGSATWMRRLWTLQEGALAESLYFQFQDRAVSLVQESKKLHEFAVLDLCYKPIAEDVSLMIRCFKLLCSPSSTNPTPNAQGSRGQKTRRYLDQVHTIQTSLYFRSVSVASDEPLCIATLLSLDPKVMTEVKTCRQERMAAVWRLLAEECGGFFLPWVIFYNDQRLGLSSLRGWRWAPKTLLPQLETGFSYDTATSRFDPRAESTAQMGVVTERGLKVSFPGKRIALRPWAEHESGRLWPWNLFTRKFVENQLLCRDAETGAWYTLSNQMRGEHIEAWTWDEWTKRDAELLAEDKMQPVEGKRPSQPIFNELCRGELALIKDTKLSGHVEVYLLARVQQQPTIEEDKNDGSLHVHACLPLSVTEIASAIWPGLDMLRGMVEQVYGSDINQELLDFLALQEGGRDPDPEVDGEYKRIEQRLRAEMQRVAADALERDTEKHLAWVSDEFIGENKRGDIWKAMVLLTPYEISVKSLPDDQVWVVDGPVVGDGLCHEPCCSPS